MNSEALALARARAAPSLLMPPRYHHSQPTKTKDTATHIKVQIAASRSETLWAPWRLMAKKSTASATSTNTANRTHSNGVPIEVICLPYLPFHPQEEPAGGCAIGIP